MNKEQAYDILHISPPATQSEITAQYRERVKDAHPDTGGSAEEFKRVKEAYTVLSE
jgi:curved DNA-binding protein CbpA